jgi:hypothetical protein
VHSYVIDTSLEKERSAFLAWVSSIDFEKTHQDIFAKKHEQTCDWLTREPKYQQWVNGSASALLWCHGKRRQVIFLHRRRSANHL